MKTLFKYFLAYTTNKHVWRVTYWGARETTLLPYKEAKSLSNALDGIMWIDYKEGMF